MTNVIEATKKDETTLRSRLQDKALKDMSDEELLAHASGSSEWDPLLKCLQGARHTAEVLRAAVFWDGGTDGLLETEVDTATLSMMFDMIRRQLQAAEELMMRDRRALQPTPGATVSKLTRNRGAR